MYVYNFINTVDPEKSEACTAFNHGCELVGLPYDKLKRVKGYPKKHGEWLVLRKPLRRFEKGVTADRPPQNFANKR